MADIIIKNKNGTPITYMGKTKIKCNTVDGGTAVFTEGGTSVEILPAPGFTLVPGEANENGWYQNPKVEFSNLASQAEIMQAMAAEGAYLPRDEILAQLSDDSIAAICALGALAEGNLAYSTLRYYQLSAQQGYSIDSSGVLNGSSAYVTNLLKDCFRAPRWGILVFVGRSSTWAFELFSLCSSLGLSLDVWVKAREGIVGISENEKRAKWNFSSLRTADNTLYCMSIVDGETGLAFIPTSFTDINALLGSMLALSTTKSVFTATPGVAVPTEADAADASTHIYQVMPMDESGTVACLWKDCAYEKHGHAIFVDGHGAFKAVTSETAAKQLPMPTVAGFAAWPADYGTEPTERTAWAVFSGIVGRLIKKDASGDGLAGLVAQMKAEYAASAENFKLTYGDFPISVSAREIDTTLTYLASEEATATITEEAMQS